MAEHFPEEDLELHDSLRSTQLQPQLAKTWLHYRKTLFLAEKYQQAIALLHQGRKLFPEISASGC
ncbi:MAG: hypothetical protein AAGE84_05545 [Cyanobacteria bacterium P01_G01_bin.39]